MATPVPSELRSTAFDWKDLVLFAAGYVVVVIGLTAFDELIGDPPLGVTRGVLALGVLGPIALRRLIFGWPALPAPKEGFGWSLLSMLGILVALFGMGAAALGVFPLWHARPIHWGLVCGGLGAVVVGAALTAIRYPRSILPEARAVRRDRA
jgi:hypothetical protein